MQLHKLGTPIECESVYKASVMSVNAEANAHGADGLISVFVNELAPPHVQHCAQSTRSVHAAVLKDYERDLS